MEVREDQKVLELNELHEVGKYVFMTTMLINCMLSDRTQRFITVNTKVHHWTRF
jgi:hypothetical protein